jgi:hypothetical protein
LGGADRSEVYFLRICLDNVKSFIFAGQNLNIKNMEMTIDVLNKDAVRLLQNMERENLIRLQPQEIDKKPSKRFAGSLHLSDEEYRSFQTYLTNSRNEWERNI